MNRKYIMKNVMIMLVLTAGLFNSEVHAENTRANVNLRGILIEPPLCTINNGDKIDVNFGERVGISKVDGLNYRIPMNYQITCNSGDVSGLALLLTLSGDTAFFDEKVLSTSKENLGIRVYQNDQLFLPGSTLKIDLASPPRLEAVLVKKTGSTLTEGAFEAWATLRADYQ